MIDWQAFKRGEFAVRCDKGIQAMRFLTKCAEHKLRWISGDEATEYCHYDSPQCYKMTSDGLIQYDTREISNTPTIDYPVFPDQSLKADADKPQLTLVPTGIIRAIAAVRAYGIQVRGGSDSWRTVDAVRLRNAAYRHWLAYVDEPDGVDADSGLPHLWHCAANIAFLVDLEGRK